MNRAETQFSLKAFFDRVACATVADLTLAAAYEDSLRSYLMKLEDDFEFLDSWSVQEYEQVCEFIKNNFNWIANPEIASQAMADAYTLIGLHKSFLKEHGFLPDHLKKRPNPSFQWTPTGTVEFMC